jgi:GT2 family glycosyltransferase
VNTPSRRPDHEDAAGGPLFSVVVPTRSRPAQIESCVDALTNLVFEPGYEVVVVHDGGIGTGPELGTRQRRGVAVTTVRQAHAGPAAARNRGASHARGRFLAFIDDDCIPGEDWLGSFESALRKHPRTVVGGPTINTLDRNLFSEASQLLVSYASKSTSAEDPSHRFFPSCNLGLDRRVFEKAGGFDRRFPGAGGEDREFCSRLASSGHRLHFAPDAVVFHRHRLTFAGYVKQHAAYGRGATLFRRLYADQDTTMARIVAPGWYLRLILCPFGRYPIHRSIPLAALLGLAQAATITGALAAGGMRRGAGAQPMDRQT